MHYLMHSPKKACYVQGAKVAEKPSAMTLMAMKAIVRKKDERDMGNGKGS